jgi:hypothetical protein
VAEKYRIDLLALPSTQTAKAYDLCGFTQVTIRFARFFKDLGHLKESNKVRVKV